MKEQGAPIGIFDSGLGGLSVWKEVVKLLPNEDIIYYADSGNCPYGEKSSERIQELSAAITDFLYQKNCKIIVVACNTATAAAIHYLRFHYRVPFIGIEPATKPAALQSKTGTIGILATKGTFEGSLFKQTKNKYASDKKVLIQIGTGLVEIVENNDLKSRSSFELVKKYIQPMVDEDTDHIVLGCTHYPFLTPIIEELVDDNVKIVNPAPAVARQTKKILEEYKLLNQKNNEPTYHFYTSGDKNKLKSFLAAHIPYKAIIH